MIYELGACSKLVSSLWYRDKPTKVTEVLSTACLIIVK